MTDDLAKELTDKMIRDAEEQVAKAQMALDQTKALVEIINNQVAAHAKQNDDMVARFKRFGEFMLDAHRILNGDAVPKPVSAPTPDLARLRALDALKRDRDLPAGSSTFWPNPGNVSGLVRDPDANYPARQVGLSQPLADLDQFRVNRPGNSEDRRDPGVATKQPGRD